MLKEGCVVIDLNNVLIELLKIKFLIGEEKKYGKKTVPNIIFEQADQLKENLIQHRQFN